MLRVGLGLHDELFHHEVLMHRLPHSPGCTLLLCAVYLNLWEDLLVAESNTGVPNADRFLSRKKTKGEGL
jgi:hypothetical protein